MKKIKKADLRLEKEVITALTADDQTGLKGGSVIPISQQGINCGSGIQKSCNNNSCINSCQNPCNTDNKTNMGNPCELKSYGQVACISKGDAAGCFPTIISIDTNDNCKPAVWQSAFC